MDVETHEHGQDMAVQHIHQHTNTQSLVSCCSCGVPILPNPTNMCVNCIRTQVDITEGITKQVTVTWCKLCGRWLQPPKHWFFAEPESKELLHHMVKRVRGLSKVKLIDASFIWTEPHSMRLKAKLTVQAEVMHGAILQQSFVVDYTVERNVCPHCLRTNTNPNAWVAAVQVRQHVAHKRTFFFLEQMILKHSADEHCVNVKDVHGGVDFYFANRAHGSKFVDFLASVVPTRHRSDKQLVSHNIHTSTYNYKYTFSVEIAPVCKEDAVFLPPKLAVALGNLGPLVVVTRVSSGITLTDPKTLRSATLDAPAYWRHAFTPLLTSRQLSEYVVLDAEPQDEMAAVRHGHAHSRRHNPLRAPVPAPHAGGYFPPGVAPPSDRDAFPSETASTASRRTTRTSQFGHAQLTKYVLSDVTVARRADLGTNDESIVTRTHLGRLLHAGDIALGYDLRAANTANPDLEAAQARGYELPDALLVRKSYAEKRRRRRARGGGDRAWKLKRMGAASGADADDELEGGEPAAADGGRGGAARAERRAAEAAAESREADLERFLEEIEEDPDVRARVSVYRDRDAEARAAASRAARSAQPGAPLPPDDSDSDSGSDAPEVPLEELLEDLVAMQLADDAPHGGADDDELADLAGGMAVE